MYAAFVAHPDAFFLYFTNKGFFYGNMRALFRFMQDHLSTKDEFAKKNSIVFSWPVFTGKAQSSALKTYISYTSLLSILRQGIPIMHLIAWFYGNYKENKTVIYCYCIKSSGGLGFQHLPRDMANVYAWKTMFDPYINTLRTFRYF